MPVRGPLPVRGGHRGRVEGSTASQGQTQGHGRGVHCQSGAHTGGRVEGSTARRPRYWRDGDQRVGVQQTKVLYVTETKVLA